MSQKHMRFMTTVTHVDLFECIIDNLTEGPRQDCGAAIFAVPHIAVLHMLQAGSVRNSFVRQYMNERSLNTRGSALRAGQSERQVSIRQSGVGAQDPVSSIKAGHRKATQSTLDSRPLSRFL